MRWSITMTALSIIVKDEYCIIPTIKKSITVNQNNKKRIQ